MYLNICKPAGTLFIEHQQKAYLSIKGIFRRSAFHFMSLPITLALNVFDIHNPCFFLIEQGFLILSVPENLKRSGSFPVRKIRFKPVFCLILLSAFHAEHLYNCFTGIFESIRTFHSGIPVCSAFVLNY